MQECDAGKRNIIVGFEVARDEQFSVRLHTDAVDLRQMCGVHLLGKPLRTSTWLEARVNAAVGEQPDDRWRWLSTVVIEESDDHDLVIGYEHGIGKIRGDRC